MFFNRKILRGKPYSGKERRQESRIRLADSFLVEFFESGFEKPILGSGRDISQHGVRFVTHQKLKKKSQFKTILYFHQRFQNAKKLGVTAKVVNVYKPKGTRRWRICCELMKQDAQKEKVIQDFMAWGRVELS